MSGSRIELIPDFFFNCCYIKKYNLLFKIFSQMQSCPFSVEPNILCSQLRQANPPEGSCRVIGITGTLSASASMGSLRKILQEGRQASLLRKEPFQESQADYSYVSDPCSASQYASFLWIPWGSGSATRPSPISKAEDPSPS